MKILLDTQCWLWMQTAPERFSAPALRLVEDAGNRLFLSSASSWEIAIKYRLGKLPLPAAPSTYVPERMSASGVEALPIEHAHALHVAELPQHHRDPFDRLLIAQAELEKLPLLTVDKQLEPYGVEILWGQRV